jgi:hypothetical protein
VIPTDRAVISFFVEPRHSIATVGEGQVEWRVFGGLNFQF